MSIDAGDGENVPARRASEPFGVDVGAGESSHSQNMHSQSCDSPSSFVRTGHRKSVLISQHVVQEVNHTHPTNNSSTRSTSISPTVTGNESDSSSRYGLKLQTSAAYLSILGHENSVVIEMSNLHENEVRDILLHKLKVDTISIDLVRLVLDVSSGNAFWCKTIASFIAERGVKALEKATEHENRINSLKQLILLRMEKLDVDIQLILKHASIIGDEFSERMLKAVLPDKLKTNLGESTELLVEHGFLFCIAEYPQFIFGFQNNLIRQTVSELTPPR
jgi:hypothetical protein